MDRKLNSTFDSPLLHLTVYKGDAHKCVKTKTDSVLQESWPPSVGNGVKIFNPIKRLVLLL